MKLVKLDDVLKLIDGSMADLESNYENSKLQEEIKRLPTVDAEPMVRCRDCKYYGSNWWIGDCHLEQWGDGWGNYPPPTVTEDGFCAWGERREDGAN